MEARLLLRFVAAAAVAAIVIAGAALLVVAVPALRAYPLTTLWCFVPAAWGLWAMLAPTSWVPQRLPIWGAMLGVVAGLLAAFVLDLPSRILGERVAATLRGLAVLLAGALYYLLWVVARSTYRGLAEDRGSTSS